MGKWMVFLRRQEARNPIFTLIAALDINVAAEIGEEIASREKYTLLGIAPYAEPDIGC